MSDPAQMSGRDLVEAALRGAVPPPPYVQLLGMRLTAVSDGSATFATTGRAAADAGAGLRAADDGPARGSTSITTRASSDTDRFPATDHRAHQCSAAGPNQTKDPDVCWRHRLPPKGPGSRARLAAWDSELVVPVA